MIRLELPYERQATEHCCGAAALVMAYRSFGLADTQAEVWERLNGRRSASTYSLAADAMGRGLAAVVLRADQAWPLLERALARNCRLILNHRSSPIEAIGHFSLVTSIGPRHVWLHDPLVGPDTRMTRTELDWCWQPTGFPPTIGGKTLVAIATRDEAAATCAACGAIVPETSTCRRCDRSFPLRPAAALGCIVASCPGRLWSRIFCPHCDFVKAT